MLLKKEKRKDQKQKPLDSRLLISGMTEGEALNSFSFLKTSFLLFPLPCPPCQIKIWQGTRALPPARGGRKNTRETPFRERWEKGKREEKTSERKQALVEHRGCDYRGENDGQWVFVAPHQVMGSAKQCNRKEKIV